MFLNEQLIRRNVSMTQVFCPLQRVNETEFVLMHSNVLVLEGHRCKSVIRQNSQNLTSWSRTESSWDEVRIGQLDGKWLQNP